MSNNNGSGESSGCFGSILKAILMIVAVTIIGRLVGGFFAGGIDFMLGSGEKTVTKDGFSITVTKEFTETTQAGYDGCLTSKKSAIGWEKANFSTFQSLYGVDLSSYSQQEILQLLASGNGWQNSEMYHNDTVGYYITHESGQYKYLECMFRGSEAYWRVMFTCNRGDFTTLLPDFLSWAATVRVS